MNLRELFLDEIERTGEGDTAVVGWGRGMGHKGHMMLASSVITHAKELGGDPYFVVSRTFGPDDPLKPEEKLAIYKKVFPEQGHIFQTATDELPDLTRVLAHLNKQGYSNAVVVVGADQVKAFQYLNAYNGKPNKAGDIPFTFDNLQVISRQETNDPSRGEEGPRATPMRQVLQDPLKSDQEQFAVWRDAMSPEISDDEVLDLMRKAKQRMQDLKPAPKKAPVKKKVAEPEKSVAEGERGWDDPQYERPKPQRDPDEWKRDRDRPTPNLRPSQDVIDSEKMAAKIRQAELEKTMQSLERSRQPFPSLKKKGVEEASYKGNIGIMELIKFFTLAKQEPELVRHVKELIADGKDQEVWRIVQKYTGTKLVGKEFAESIRESISTEYKKLKNLYG